MSETIVCIVAHPDDESFACGGTLAQHIAHGDGVMVWTCADGVSSRPSAVATDASRRALHFQYACDALGIGREDRFSSDIFPDQEADMVPQLVINRAVAKMIANRSPARVYTHSTADLNHDHRRVAEAVLVATRGLCEVWCAEPEWLGRTVRPFAPTQCVTLTEKLLTYKLLACAAYRDELREPPHPRSLAVLREKTVERFEVYE